MPLTASVTSSASTTNPEWVNVCTELYAQGAADVEIARALGITIADFYEMEKELPEFAKFVAKGRTLSQAWWVERARKNLTNKEFNTALYNFNMKNRYGWADKIETKETADEKLRDADTLRNEVFKAAKKLSTKYPELMRELGEQNE